MDLTRGGTSTRLLPIKEASERLGVCKTKTHTLIRDGELEARKIGRRTLIPDAAIETFIANLPRAGRTD
jgi:excisionase family DNA binding protein